MKYLLALIAAYMVSVGVGAVVSVELVQAQTTTTRGVCYFVDGSGAQYANPADNVSCSDSSMQVIQMRSGVTHICVENGQATEATPGAGPSGRFTCPNSGPLAISPYAAPGGNTNGNNNTPPTNPPTPNANCTNGFQSQGPLQIPCNPFANSNSFAGSSNLNQLITRVINTMLFLGGIAAVIVIIIGGYLYIAARGNEAQAKKGAQALQFAIIGLILILLSYMIVNVLVDFITRGT